MSNPGDQRKWHVYHCHVQDPHEPLTVFQVHVSMRDQSQGMAELTDVIAWHAARGAPFKPVTVLAEVPSSEPGNRLCHACYVVWRSHEHSSADCEACEDCDDLQDHWQEGMAVEPHPAVIIIDE